MYLSTHRGEYLPSRTERDFNAAECIREVFLMSQKGKLGLLTP